jgi:WD40 repeat protein
VDVAFAGSSPILPLHSKLTRWFAFHPGQRLLLIIDQFEELITLTRDVQARQQFQQSLAELLQHHSDNLRIILTLRTDFETQFADSPLAAHWQTGRYVVPPLTQADLRAVIEGPAAERVLYFEPPELVDKLIDEVIQTPGALPLLSFTLSEMYIKYVASGSDNRALAQEYYEELGGVIGSLRTRATQEYEQLPDDRYRATMRRMMLRMISTEGGEVARRRVPLSELVYPDAQENEQVAVVLDRLVAVRLLVRDSADVDEDGSKDPYVEPAHDALVRAWDKLLEWRHKAEGYLPLQRRVSQAARTWHGADDASKPGLLWNNDPGLPQLLPHIFQQSSALRAMTRAIGSLWMMDHLDDKPDWLNQVESDFVHKSLQQRTRIRQRIVAITLAVMVGLAGLALYASRQALENKSVALASSAQQAMQSRNRDLAIALGLAAIDLRNPPALAVNALAAASFGPGTQVTPFAAHTDAIVAVALSPDGNTAVSAALDGRTFVWDARTNEIHHMLHEPAPVTKALFSPMGRDVLLGFQDGSLIMWDTTSGNIVHRYTGYQAPISAMAYSVDGKHALVGDEQGTLLLWDMGNKTQVRELVRQDGAPLGAITAVAFSHNGLQALASTGDGQISRWDLASGDEIQRIDSRNRAVLMVAFAQDDTYLFAGYSDGFVRLWDTTTGRGTRSFLMAEHTQGIDAMTVAHDGTTMATGAWDGSVILWGRPEVGGMIHALVGHRAPVVTLAYSQDGRFVLSGSKDGTVRLWDVSAPTLLRRFWVGPLRSGGPPVDTSNYVALDPVHRRVLSAAFDAVVLVNLDTGEEEQTILVEPDYLASVALSHDGETALIGQEGHIIVRNLAHQEEVRRFEPKSGESGLPIHMTFSTDDRTVFAAFEDGTLSAWAVATGEQLWEYLIPSTILWSVAFSQDGKYAVSVDEDKRVVLWDLQTGSEMRRFAGDEDFKGHEDAVYDVALSDDGARLLTASADRRIILWEVATGRPLRTFEGHSLPVRTVAFGPGEATVLSGSEDRTVRLWDISTGTEQFRFEGHSTTVQDVLPLPNVSQPKAWLIFSRDMRSGHIVWQPPPTDVQEIVADTHANRYVRALTCDERLLYKVSPLCQGE